MTNYLFTHRRAGLLATAAGAFLLVAVVPLSIAAASAPAGLLPVVQPVAPCESGVTAVAVRDATVGLSAPVTINAAAVPVVMTNISTSAGAAISWNSNAVAVTRTAFQVRVASHSGPSTVTLSVQWLACATTPTTFPTTPPPTVTSPPVTPTTPPPTTTRPTNPPTSTPPTEEPPSDPTDNPPPPPVG